MLFFIYDVFKRRKILAEKYLPLYRKYRPSNFNEVVGQQVVVKTLLNAIAHNRVAHAYLFCGPRGTGKTSIARIFSKTLNCLDLKDGVPCGKCAHCVDMNNTISMDVIEIDAASNRKVEDARNLLEKVQFTPVLGKNKIYIIDEVHMLTTEAFNTLLKTLEEPPENLVFILATTEAHKVMETIVSRCQKFDFRRISVDDIKNRLKEISQKENIAIEDDAIEFIARRSAGGLRDALALLDQSTVLALENKSITKKDIVTLLGSVDDEDLFNLADMIAQKNPNQVISLLKTIVDKGNDPNQVIKELISYFRNLMLASVCKDTQEASKLLDISAENCERIVTQAKTFSAQELVQIIEELSNQERNIRNSTNPYLWLDVAIINAATRENILAQKALLDRIEDLENQMKSGFVPRVQTLPTQSATVQQKPAVQSPPAENIMPQVSISQEIKTQTANAPSEQSKTNQQPQQDKTTIVEMPEIRISASVGKEEPAEEKTSSAMITLQWDTFLGELQQINPAVYGLVKAQSRPITTTSDKIELAFRNEIFIDKIRQKQQLLETVAKKLCGKVPIMVFRKITDEDFKKKITVEPAPQMAQQNQSVAKQSEPELTPPPKASNEPDIDIPSVDEIKEIKTNIENKKSLAPSVYDLPDDARQILEVFSGKILD